MWDQQVDKSDSCKCQHHYYVDGTNVYAVMKNVCVSTNSCGCVVNDSFARAAFEYYYYLLDCLVVNVTGSLC